MTDLPLSSQLKRYLRNAEINLDESDDIPREKVIELLIAVDKSYQEKKKEVSILENALDISSIEIHEYLRDLDEKSALLTNTAKMSALGEMAGSVAHEINTPLAIILGTSQRLLRKMNKGDDNPKVTEEGLSLINKTVERIVKIVNGLRIVSRTAEHDEKEVVSIINVIDDSLVLCQEKFRNNGITLHCDYDLSLELYALGRSAQFSQVLLNLLNNSFDSVCLQDERWIKISVSSNSERVKLRVTDSGLPIEIAIVDKIMNPFYTTKDVGKGTGLGLSISKSIIEDHNGAFYYDNESPTVSFVIELPIAN